MSVHTATITLSELFQRFDWPGPEEFLHAAKVSLWGRWFMLAFCLAEVNYRVEYGSLSHALNNLYIIGFMAANGYFYFLARRIGDGGP